MHPTPSGLGTILMGIPCSNERKPPGPDLEKDAAMPKHVRRRASGRLKKLAPANTVTTKRVEDPGEYYSKLERDDRKQAAGIVAAQDGVINSRRSPNYIPALDGSRTRTDLPRPFLTPEQYFASRDEVVEREAALAFDWRCSQDAKDKEQDAAYALNQLRALDDQELYGKEGKRTGYGGQKHARFAGDHFLSNVELIERSHLFQVAKQLPKGAHLHIHFNACLRPDVLLGIAKTMDRMFIWSTLPLTSENNYLNYDLCEIQFSILAHGKERDGGDLFSKDYEERGTMRFQEFRERFPEQGLGISADNWLLRKLVFDEEETHNKLQTAAGAWAKFNGRTRMMKGLFNYETAYRRYTRGLLEDFVRDKIQYAEIRPNFMATNQLWTDDGTEMIDNAGIMDIIIEEYDKFAPSNYFAGLGIIYCTPRSFEPNAVADALAECLRFKLNPRYRKWIVGFDLVGEEGQGKPLKAFVQEFLQFQSDCAEKKVEIPFLFHCGETLEIGTDTDGNILDALLLNSRRIGHGFSLARHPYVMEQMKSRGVCLELCPISNEVLGLTPRVSGHAMYNLLANNVHCTVSSDNGTLFRSTLSHDFYQVFVGKADMSLFGWKQLILWSLQHSCLDKLAYVDLQKKWDELWGEFVDWLIEYGKEHGISAPSAEDPEQPYLNPTIDEEMEMEMR